MSKAEAKKSRAFMIRYKVAGPRSALAGAPGQRRPGRAQRDCCEGAAYFLSVVVVVVVVFFSSMTGATFTGILRTTTLEATILSPTLM